MSVKSEKKDEKTRNVENNDKSQKELLRGTEIQDIIWLKSICSKKAIFLSKCLLPLKNFF